MKGVAVLLIMILFLPLSNSAGREQTLCSKKYGNRESIIQQDGIEIKLTHFDKTVNNKDAVIQGKIYNKGTIHIGIVEIRITCNTLAGYTFHTDVSLTKNLDTENQKKLGGIYSVLYPGETYNFTIKINTDLKIEGCRVDSIVKIIPANNMVQ